MSWLAAIQPLYALAGMGRLAAEAALSCLCGAHCSRWRRAHTNTRAPAHTHTHTHTHRRTHACSSLMTYPCRQTSPQTALRLLAAAPVQRQPVPPLNKAHRSGVAKRCTYVMDGRHTASVCAGWYGTAGGAGTGGAIAARQRPHTQPHAHARRSVPASGRSGRQQRTSP